ncbi:uncharacterized protein RhoGEF3 isoform X2 [Drosophila montana]|uniref:uncharacterized protein RhoGEF3 isoform X2 n=1 Tax=Drosophila montana TaxID=40370 RepID=UPI00313B46A3
MISLFSGALIKEGYKEITAAMATETFLDLTSDRAKSSKRPIRPKLLKLPDVTTPHRSRKKIKIKSKDRPAAVRDRIYDDPAYTEDISHLANPQRRSSISGKSSRDYKLSSDNSTQPVASSSSLGKRSQLTKDFLKYAMNAPSNSGAVSINFDSSSSDNEQPRLFKDGSVPRRALSLERNLAVTGAEKNDKKSAPQKRSSKQKRNLSLDNSRKGTQPHLQQIPAKSIQSYELETLNTRKEHNRKKYLETEMKLGRGSSDQDDLFSVRSSAQNSAATLPIETNVKLPIGRRLLKGEIGIKSFNYYLLKEGLKSSKKLDKKRNTGDTAGNSVKKLHTRSEENIYEEIFFKDTPSSIKPKNSAPITAGTVLPDEDVERQHQQQQQCLPDSVVFADCELCMQQCRNENCKYCLVQGESTANSQLQQDNGSDKLASTESGFPAAHILEFQSYNPSNPGVYKIETTPVAITGEYNPILQFQKSSAKTSTSATISSCEQQHNNNNHRNHQQQDQHQKQQPAYRGFNKHQEHSRSHQHNLASRPLANHYNVGGSLLLAQVTARQPQPQQHLQQGYIVGYKNGSVAPTASSGHRINTKSSSSSDSLPYHKYNTMPLLDANVFAAPATADIYYAIGGVGAPSLHPLMCAASRPIGGSQILVDQFESHMYKSDSKASILSEFSLRSSDNSQRYSRYPHRSSLFSSHTPRTNHRRLFGSTENCRVAYDCRRCSFDGVMSAAGVGVTPADKCSNTDNCRYECRNCDCSSSYFSSDFDDIYGSMARGGSSGIPRKTAAGTLPSSGPTDPTTSYKAPTPEQPQPQQLDLKQNKYAMDFFKHVNDVKRSIYQSETQRNNSLDSTRRGYRTSTNNNSDLSPKIKASYPLEATFIVTTLPLSKGRGMTAKPTPAPRTSLKNQSQKQTPEEDTTHTQSNRKLHPTEIHEYPSLDRLVASTTGATPKWQSRATSEEGPKGNKQRTMHKETELRERRDRSAPTASIEPIASSTVGTSGKKHHRSNSGNPASTIRRKDIPAPPPPSPATYSDLQELKANMEGLQDDTKSRSLESEASETPTTTGQAAVKIVEATVKCTEPVVLTDAAQLALIAEETGKSNATMVPSKTAPEADDDDVFYDARSENSIGGLSVAPSTEGALQSSNSGQKKKDVCFIQPELDKSGVFAQSVGTNLTTNLLQEQEQLKDIVENSLPSTTMDATESSQPLPNDDYVAGAKSKTSTEASIKKSCHTCCQTEATASIQHNEATVKTNTEVASTTKGNNNTSITEVTTRNVDATIAEGQATSLMATNVAYDDSTIIGATLELEFSCNSAHTDSATLANSDPPTVTTEIVATCQDITCLDSSEAFSDDSHLTRDSVTRESQNDELSSSTHDKIDLSTLPLPALPTKRRRTRLRASPSKNHHQQQPRLENSQYEDAAAEKTSHRNKKPQRYSVQETINIEQLNVPHDNAKLQQNQQQQQHLSAFQQYVAKRRESLEASTRNFNEKLEARRMLCHMGGNGGSSGSPAAAATDAGVPTYIFGENFYGISGGTQKPYSQASNKEEIFLNKSGWVQVSKKLNTNSDNKGRRVNNSHHNGEATEMDKAHGRKAIRVIQIGQAHRQEQNRQTFPHNSASRCDREPKFVGSKVEELIQRNEARLGGISSRDSALRPGYRIVDPQLASILNERPGFLPVTDLDSPPPITPILSPPPAFQDNSSKSNRTNRHQERRKINLQSYVPTQQLRVLQTPIQMQQQPGHGSGSGTSSGKGMVFSRSFEYDMRRPTPANRYVDTFSRSFDDNLSERPVVMPSLAVQRERSLNFSTLTGNSPNYLTKREGGGGGGGGRSLRSRENSPKYLQPQTTAYLNASVKEAPPAYSVASNNMAKYSPRSRHDRAFERSKSHNVMGRSRKSQFSCISGNSGSGSGGPPPIAQGMSRFRSLDMTINNRLNSCDSGARSENIAFTDLSNDELDIEEGSSTEFLSTNYQLPNVATGSASVSPFKTQRQRSLTPDRNDSHSSSSSLRKQRSLTPDSRSLTPEERRKKGSQISLIGSRQNSSSRSNTLERRQRHDDKTPPTISRSSSSSSYSGGESHDLLNGSPNTASSAAGGASCATNYRRSMGRTPAKQVEQEHLIRRSRSLQLSERSPNRTQKSIVCVSGGVSPLQKQQATAHYQQANTGIFPNSLRATVSANKLLPSSKGATGNSTARQRQVDLDKARSFDFDYNNYNRSGATSNATRSAHTSGGGGGGGGDSGNNPNLRSDCDKSRSFDEDYRAALHNNNGISSSGIHFFKSGSEPNAVVSSSTRLRHSNSPVGGAAHDRTPTRSPQSSGSSSNNIQLTSQCTSSPPANSGYGMRLCDHELSYDMLRKSPIMNFRRGDSEYEIPMQLRNRETINSGGNSELNFMSNETHIYEHPTTVLNPQRSGSREEHLYRATGATPRSSSPEPQTARTATNKKCRKSLTYCDYWPRCSACSSTSSSNLQDFASLGQSAIRGQDALPVVTQDMQQPHISKVALKGNLIKFDISETATRISPSQAGIPQWMFLCSGGINRKPERGEANPHDFKTTSRDRRQPTAVIRPRVVPLTASSLVLLGGNCDLVTGTQTSDAKEQSRHVPTESLQSTMKNNLENANQSELSNQEQQLMMNRNKRKRPRCNSLPVRISAPPKLQPVETVVRLPKSGKDNVSIIGIRCSGNGECLSQQMRAISSPALTGSVISPKYLQDEFAEARELTKDAAATTEASFDCGIVEGNQTSLGVLQKFKRTLHNLNNRNQLQITPLHTGAVVNADTKPMPINPMVSITVPAPVVDNKIDPTDNCGVDTSSAKYRFGPLIWRSSKERRKTKFNRRDKCNSGDSGIQIELELDEQYMRTLASGQPRAASALTNPSSAMDRKARTIRRCHSAKASTIMEQAAVQPPVNNQLNKGSICNIEREAPESLPTRSLSQPSGLEIYGKCRTDIEDSDSDSIASHEEANNFCPIYAEVLYNFTAAGPQELGLERGTLIEILRKEVGPWWFGRIKKEDVSLVEEIHDPEIGWFPKEFVRIIHSCEINALLNVQKTMKDDVSVPAAVADIQIPVPVSELNTGDNSANAMTLDQSNITTIVIESPSSTVLTLPPRINEQQDSYDIIRYGAVRELLETEINYVKLLASICDGYLPAMSKRIDIFSPNSIRLIFSNITAIYKFQRKFLEALRNGIEQNQVSKVFLKMHKGFLCYSTYCNAYPRALIELESYERIKDARTILENCRESENLAELPLSAHLLAPVQRICRYPLHLNELIKTAFSSNLAEDTNEVAVQTDILDYEQIDLSQCDVPDTHDTVNLALKKMRGITEAVNEGKRHSETIARHQSSFQNFKGPPLHLHSTRFFIQVDATRQKQNLWNSSCTLFLFDNQLIYCKRDIIKRSQFIYKGRIFLDRCRIVNVRDGKMFGHTIKNSLRIYCESRDKWYDFSFRSANRKHRFLNTLALERQFGGKALYVSEMTGFEYNYEERPGYYSDQSEYELPECEPAQGNTSASGDSSVPESPAKSPYRSCDTLPKKSQSRDAIASTSNGSGHMSTGSLGRRRLGNWFRKPKSSNCTPSQSPTHKPNFDADLTLTAARVAAIEMVRASAAQQEADSSFA